MTFNKESMQRISEIHSAYRTFLEFENRKINLNNYLEFAKAYVGYDPKICKTCSASIKRFHSEFQVKVLSDLYREFPSLATQPDTSKLSGTIYATTAKASLITASIEIHQTLINKFKSDYTNKKFNIDLDKFKEVYNEMISLLTSKIKYFSGDIYKSFIQSAYPIQFVKIEPLESIVEHTNEEIVDEPAIETIAEVETNVKQKARKKGKTTPKA